MVDILYNVLARPIANEPTQKDAYHVDRAQKDARIKNIEEDEPDKDRQQGQNKEKNEATEVEPTPEGKLNLDERLENKKKGKGLYKDKEGKDHLDFYA